MSNPPGKRGFHMFTHAPIFLDRLQQAEQTLQDAVDMQARGSRPKHVLRRTYYAMMYGIISLFERDHVTFDTWEHGGVISLFEREYVSTGKVNKKYYQILHNMFIIREESYNKTAQFFTPDAAIASIDATKHFLSFVRSSFSTLH